MATVLFQPAILIDEDTANIEVDWSDSIIGATDEAGNDVEPRADDKDYAVAARTLDDILQLDRPLGAPDATPADTAASLRRLADHIERQAARGF